MQLQPEASSDQIKDPDIVPVRLTPSIAAFVIIDGDGAASRGGGEWHRQRRSLHIAASIDEMLQQRKAFVRESGEQEPVKIAFFDQWTS